MKKILFVLTTLGQGGTEQCTLRFISYNRDNDYTVMATMGVGGVLEEEYRKVSKVVLDFKIGYLDLVSMIKLYKFLNDEKFDTIVDMHGIMSGMSMWIAKKSGISNRISFYRNTDPGFDPTWYKKIYAWIQLKLMTKYSTKIFSNSKTALNKYHPGWENAQNRFKVIYNGLDMRTLSYKTKSEVRQYLGIPKDTFVIGHSGRVNWQKNHKMILASAERLCRKYDNIIFLLMGKGTDTLFGEEVIKRGLKERVRLMGNRRDVLDILKCLDVYYFPSICEGQPNALIEAMASGVPIVASNHESIIETVPDYIRPNLVSPYDEDSNFYTLEKMYLDTEFRESQKCEIWAKEHYDAAINFEKLKKEL